MQHDALYTFLLDLFPLTDEVIANNVVIGDALQRAAVDALLKSAEGADVQSSLSLVRVLLWLSRDLGYTSPEVVAYLERSLSRLSSQA